MYNSQYYTCEQIDQRLLQGYLDDYNTQNNTSLTKAEFLALLFNTIGRNSTIDNLVTQIGYYECDTAAGTAAKTITVANYNLFAGGSMKVKFVNKNTANNATLNINSKGAKALYYQGERVSSTNSWDDGEVVEIYYDGTSYYANSVKGGSSSGVYDISVEHPTGGPNNDGKFTLEYILDSTNVNELIPVNKRWPGMDIQFVSLDSNEYVRVRLKYPSFSRDISKWQGVDNKPLSGSDNIVKSGNIGNYINRDNGLLILENGSYDLTHAQVDNPLLPNLNNKRVRTTFIKAKYINIECNDGYIIKYAIYIDRNGNFISYSLLDRSHFTRLSDTSSYFYMAFSFGKVSGEDIDSSEDIIKNYSISSNDYSIVDTTPVADKSSIKALSLLISYSGTLKTLSTAILSSATLLEAGLMSAEDKINLSKVVVESKDTYEAVFETEEQTITIDSPVHTEGGSSNWNVSAATGEFVASSSSGIRATELQLDSSIKTITYNRRAYTGNFGYAFLDDNDNLILGVHTTEDGPVDINAVGPISQGATKFRCSNQSGGSSIALTVYSETRENRIGAAEHNIQLLNALVNSQQSALNQANSKISDLDDAVFETEQETHSETSDVQVHEEGGSNRWNVSSDTGAFTQTANNIRAIEIALTSNVLSISYYAWAYSGNFGCAFLDDNDNLILGIHTTEAAMLTVDATGPIAQGATKFRCGSSSHNDTTKKITVKYLDSETTISRIEKLEEALDIKEPFSQDTIRISFDTKREIPNNIFGQSDVNSVTFEDHTGYGLLGLAYDYQPYGKKSKLAIFFHGSGGYGSHNSTDFQQDMKPYIEFMRKSGYTVLAPYAWDETTNYHAFATQYSIANFSKAVKYVIDKYNVEDDGVYIWGRSAGGSGVLTFAYNSGIKVKAIALHHALIGTFRFEHNVTGGDAIIKKYIFDDDPNFEWTEQYLSDNYYKIAPFENMFNGLIDPNLSLVDKVKFLYNNTYNAQTWKSYIRNLPFPCKIWAAADDVNVSYNNILIFHQQVINGGGYCEFRQLPSNYTDDVVTEANHHHVVDYSGPRSTVTTKLGYTVEISNGYIETVEWFDRF